VNRQADATNEKLVGVMKAEEIDIAATFPLVILITPVRYTVSSEHIRILQVTSIHGLMEKYKNSAKQQRDEKPRSASSSGGIKINLT
jgi:hypothetical protein